MFGLPEVQEDDGCGEMNGRVEVCFLLVVILVMISVLYFILLELVS